METLKIQKKKYKQKLEIVQKKIDEIKRKEQEEREKKYNQIHADGHLYRKLGIAESSCGYCNEKNGGGNLINSLYLFSREFFESVSIVKIPDELLCLKHVKRFGDEDLISKYKEMCMSLFNEMFTEEQLTICKTQAKKWVSEVDKGGDYRTFQGYIRGIEQFQTKDSYAEEYAKIRNVARGELTPLYEMRWPTPTEMFGLLLLYGMNGFELDLPFKKHSHGN